MRGTYAFGDVLAGYGFEGDTYSINVMAGVNAVNHMLSRFDPEIRAGNGGGSESIRQHRI